MDDWATTGPGAQVVIDVLANDIDPDGDPLGIANLGAAANGTVILVDQGTADPSDNVLQYTPDAGFFGIDSFSYTASDGNGGTDTAIVTLGIDDLLISYQRPYALICAHWRSVIEVTVAGLSAKRFQARQHASTMAG